MGQNIFLAIKCTLNLQKLRNERLTGLSGMKLILYYSDELNNTRFKHLTYGAQRPDPLHEQSKR